MNGKAGLNRKAAMMCNFPEGSQAEISVVYTFHLPATPPAPHLPLNSTPTIFRSICMSCLCYLAPHKNRLTCLLPTPTLGCGPPLSLFFFAGCGLEVAKLFLEESQRQKASSRERGVGEGVSRLKHTPRSLGTFSSCGAESSALPGILGWQGWLAGLRVRELSSSVWFTPPCPWLFCLTLGLERA